MSNIFDDFRAKLREAQDVQKAAEQNAYAMAELVIPHLRSLSNRQLERMKRELANYNMHTGKWKP